jgi:predicted  nucleic acid-binding Zn-ribbon protein
MRKLFNKIFNFEDEIQDEKDKIKRLQKEWYNEYITLKNEIEEIDTIIDILYDQKKNQLEYLDNINKYKDLQSFYIPITHNIELINKKLIFFAELKIVKNHKHLQLQNIFNPIDKSWSP